ncbi:MAG: hypothetical protein JNK67_16805, partial [Alphaproteobacteria bacterium]|nr:hypothetical protein [Alphaproteobacteria bacterium]
MKTRIKPARRPRRVRPAAETVEAPDHRVTLRILPVMPVPPAPSSLARPTFPPLGPAAVPAIASGGVPPPPADDQPARHVDVVALSFALELLSELRSMHGLQLLIEMRAQAERGQRPMTLGEALEFMIYRRGLSPAGSKKVMRQLIRQNLLIPAHSPCIDKAKDLLAGRRLMHAFPIVARPYTVFRVSSEGELRRKKFDTAYLEPARLDPADVRLAEWLRLWRSQIRPGDDVPRSLTPFFSSDLNRRPSPSIT